MRQEIRKQDNKLESETANLEMRQQIQNVTTNSEARHQIWKQNSKF